MECWSASVIDRSCSTPKQYNVAGDFTFGASGKKRKREESQGEEKSQGIVVNL